jgi:hypothetical protein
MKKFLRRIRGALGMGFVWGVGGLGVGGLIELLANILPGGFPISSAVDMWPQLLAMVGFLGGAIFAIVLGIAGGRRRFDELSLPAFTALGAVAGLVLGALTLALGAGVPFIAFTTVLSAIGAASSLMLARKAEKRELLAADADLADVGLTEAEARELLGRGD